MTKLLELATEWLRMDKDPITRTEVETLIQQHNTDELEIRLGKRVSFGTAGLRGKVEAGFSRINCLTIIQTSQGLAQYLIDSHQGAREAGVVIGYDGRRDSRKFAQLTAAAFNLKGFKIFWCDRVVHTPLVPFGVRARKASAGIMITASHNPKYDNGYKVYNAKGCQINAPEDEAIQSSIRLNLEPETWEIPQLVDARESIASEYFQTLAIRLGIAQNLPPFSYTPLHGVGLMYLRGALEAVSWRPNPISRDILDVVPAQANPDPEFPTVEYPNPEEHGALDLAISHAEKSNTKLIIANDPDADRLAVAQKLPSGWYRFKGDEIGTLLGYYLHQTYKVGQNEPCLMVTSAVSSEMLAAIGAVEGFDVEETLTGFKWIGQHALRAGKRAIFGYEEALGYMIPSIVQDKDGVSAAVLLLQACSEWQELPYAILTKLWRKYGYFETINTYWKSPDSALTRQIFDVIQSDPKSITKSFAPEPRYRIRDLSRGTDTGTIDGKSKLPFMPQNLMITIWLTGNSIFCEGVRCSIRASGTEPKIKVYIECHSKSSSERARRGALEVLHSVKRTWFLDSRLQMERSGTS